VKRVRVVIFLKPGVLDAQGQAVATGLKALGYPVAEVRVGRAVELALPEGVDPEELCARFLANPLIEEWRVEEA
jgi:phosphoribosylformylglycinamidine synthase